ncbi:redox-active disulfide protein 2 [Deferribacter desulfuricans SSM1]|uniref:Redox-active disulfide protein 2 n=1 Tax=Deferribacter desulfuricans (strain DSM 14783 / JCM 11476 / NBRC 101012 / SSM1) TaxID=639282 RepID=D3P8T7_DEFDS|nr:thioredoxin family protein [Deferribacter desulfuricans]BAI81127.1 redox-active disulfide protein 2 [Deferribacter desulfuricans SSM1]
MNVKVLGTGCRNCEFLYQATLKALEELQIDATVEYVKDINEISKYVMFTPGLVINEKVVHEGKPLPNVEQLKEIISKIK